MTKIMELVEGYINAIRNTGDQMSNFTDQQIELLIDAVWMRQRCFIAGDKRFREYSDLLEQFMKQKPGYTPGQYR